jgi:hypothetical protein
MTAEREDGSFDSNEIEIEIVQADARWQAEQLGDAVTVLSAALEAPNNQGYEARTEATRRIWYLDTPESVVAAGRLLGTVDVQTALMLQAALRGSRHGDGAAAAMKQALRSPDQPVTEVFLGTLAYLEAEQQSPGAKRDKSWYDDLVRRGDLLHRELANVIEQKEGSAKAISIKTLLDSPRLERVPAALTSEIAALFLELPAMQQADLLRNRWDKIAGPEMIPALRQIYDSAPQTDSHASPLVATAVDRLFELDPNRTRTLLIDEMKRSVPRLPYSTLAILPDATLPEMDPILLTRLGHGVGAEELIARYATGAILEPVRTFYAKRDAMMRTRASANGLNINSPACEPPLVAYFLRVDPTFGERVLRDSLADRSYPMGRCWMSIIGKTASYYVNPEWEKTAIMALQDPVVVVKSDAATSLGQYGSAGSASALLSAFRYWHDWWDRRPADLNNENRLLERAYLEATVHAKNWTATEEQLREIRDLCVTQECSSEAEQELRKRK